MQRLRQHVMREGGISRRDAEQIRRWFFALIRSFRGGDADMRRNMLLKKQHTLRVMREAISIGRALGLSPGDLRLAEVIVLLHDVGRFEQYARYRTFSDPKSTNHARLSLKIIKQSGILNALHPENRTIIRRAILYHNRPLVPASQTPRVRFFSQLLRDADKLDIWRLVIGYYNALEGKKNHAISIGFKDTPGISKEVCDDIRQRRIINSKHLRNLNDFKLLQMGWVFDLNFEPTFRTVARRRYMEKLQAVLPAVPEVDEACSVIRTYLNALLHRQ